MRIYGILIWMRIHNFIALSCTCHFSEPRYFCLQVLATAADSEAAGADLTETGAASMAAEEGSMAAGVRE